MRKWLWGKIFGCNHRNAWEADSKRGGWVCRYCGEYWYVGKGMPPGGIA